MLPGPASGVGASPARPVLHQPDLAAVDVSAVELVQGALHVRVGAELDHALVGALLMGVRVCHLSSLTHEVLSHHRKRFSSCLS